MTKKIKQLYLILLSAVLLVCVGFLLLTTPFKASALSYRDPNDDYSKDITFTAGASIQASDFARDVYTLGFEITSNSPRHEDLTEWGDNPGHIHFWAKHIASNQYSYCFTIYKTQNNKETPVVKYRISYRWAWGNGGANDITLVSVIGKQELAYYDDAIKIRDLPTLSNKDLNVDETYCLDKEVNYVKSLGYDIVDKGKATESLFTKDSHYIAVTVDSAIMQYSVQLDWSYYWLASVNIFDVESYNKISQTVRSETRSIHNVISNMNEAGTLEDVFETPELIAKAEKILSDETITKIKIKYLEQLGDSPFATHVYKYVDVPLLNGVSLDDVYSALDVDNLDCLESYCYEFRYNQEEDVYEAYYLKNIWLRSMTTDGNYLDYFLDINLSYEDYYKPFMDSKIFSAGLYEYVFSTMIKDYPDIREKQYSEIYGYFGMVVIPSTATLNTLWVEMFDIETSTAGTCKKFQYDEKMSHEAYQKLLSDYEYSWLEKAWQGVAGLFTEYSASYYMFYSQPGVREALIGEGGQTDAEDPDGAIKEDFDKVVDEMELIGGNIWDWISSPFKSKIGLTGIAIAVGVGVLGYMYFTGKLKPGSSKGKSKKRRK